MAKGLNLVYQGMATDLPLQFIYVSNDEPAAEAAPAAAPLGMRCRETDVSKILSKIKKDTLQSICEDLYLPVTGNKDALARSIVNHTATMWPIESSSALLRSGRKCGKRIATATGKKSAVCSRGRGLHHVKLNTTSYFVFCPRPVVMADVTKVYQNVEY